MNRNRPLSKAAALALLTMAHLGYGQKRWDAPRIVTTYCSGCHGIDGNAQLPYMPKLAGLDASYAEKKLNAFREPASPPVDELYWWLVDTITVTKDIDNLTPNERVNMEGVAHAAKPELIKEAVVWYACQPPVAGHMGNRDLAAKGASIFKNGVPDRKVLACVSCHGQNAQGQGPAPRLAGQNAQYIEAQLSKFRKGDRKHAPEMTMITRDLDPDQARAVAAYLQSR